MGDVRCKKCGGSNSVKRYKIAGHYGLEYDICSDCFQEIVMDVIELLISRGDLNRDVFRSVLGQYIIDSDGVDFKRPDNVLRTEEL